MTKTAEILIALLRSAVAGTREIVDVAGVDFEELFSLAKRHDLAPIVYDELAERDALGEGEIAQQFKKQYELAMYRHLQRDVAIRGIRGALEEAQIPFVLLKGAHLMELYPQPWMRTSSDVDLLVDERYHAAATQALKQIGFRPFAATPHDTSFYTPERYHVELHFLLVEDDRLKGVSRVLDRVWDYTEPVDGRVERVLRDDMFYFYHVAHMAKHVKSGGCGIRSFADLWLLDHKRSFDAEGRQALLRESGIGTFAEKAEALSEAWFSGREDPATQELADFVVGGGLYGSLEHNIVVRKKQTDNRFTYYLSRVFLPYSNMKYAYPVLQKCPVLLPVFWVVRWCKLLNPTVRKRAEYEIKTEQSMSQSDRERIESLMKRLELW